MDLEELRRKLQDNRTLQKAANSTEARRLLEGLDLEQAERAARHGDTAALDKLMTRLLSTAEGRNLAERVRSAVQSHE